MITNTTENTVTIKYSILNNEKIINYVNRITKETVAKFKNEGKMFMQQRDLPFEYPLYFSTGSTYEGNLMTTIMYQYLEKGNNTSFGKPFKDLHGGSTIFKIK